MEQGFVDINRIDQNHLPNISNTDRTDPVTKILASQQYEDISDLYYCSSCDSYMTLDEKDYHLLSHQAPNQERSETIPSNYYQGSNVDYGKK